MIMEFYIVNESLDIIGIIDNYKSAIWTERYYESGDFEIYLSATEEILGTIQKNQYIVRMDDPSKAMVVECLKLTTSADGGDYLTISGRSLSSILSRRIVWTQTTYSGYLEKAVRRIVVDNFMSPEVVERTVSQMELGTEIGITEKVKAQFTGDVVETAIQSLCMEHKVGYTVEMDLTNKRFKFVLLEGQNRSYNQNANPYVVFSVEFDNLLSSEYKNDDTKYKNVAQVAGEGQGIERKKAVVGTASGLNRYEVFVDAKNQSTNGGEINAATYLNILAQKGAAKLADLGTTESIDSEVAPNQNFVLNRDYFLGDVVEIVNEYGIAMTPRVVEVIECNNENGYTCLPTFASDD